MGPGRAAVDSRPADLSLPISPPTERQLSRPSATRIRRGDGSIRGDHSATVALDDPGLAQAWLARQLSSPPSCERPGRSHLGSVVGGAANHCEKAHPIQTPAKIPRLAMSNSMPVLRFEVFVRHDQVPDAFKEGDDERKKKPRREQVKQTLASLSHIKLMRAEAAYQQNRQ